MIQKQTSIGEIPEDWEVVKVNDIFEVYGGTTPSTKKSDYWNGDIYWVTPTDITKSEELYLKDTEKKITDKAIKETSLRILSPGTLLLTSRATIGHTIINSFPVTINQGITAFIKKNNNTDNVYYAYFFKYRKEYLEQLGGGSTFKEVSRSTLKNLLIPLPPLPEQRKIAEILSTVDNAIQKVSDAIAKTERMKKGLMQELLTSGIGHVRFKFSRELGCEIPEEWEVSMIDKKCIVGTGGTPSRNNPEYFGGNILWVKSTEVDYNIITNTEETLTELGLKNSNAKIYPTGTLIIAMYGQGITRGKCALLGVNATINQACAAIVPKEKNNVYIPYLYYWCQFKYEQIRRLGQGANQSNLNLSLIRSIKVAFPSIVEQRKIAEILSTVDRKLELEKKRKEKLERIKKGLMNDLLTGKRRVKAEV